MSTDMWAKAAFFLALSAEMGRAMNRFYEAIPGLSPPSADWFVAVIVASLLTSLSLPYALAMAWLLSKPAKSN